MVRLLQLQAGDFAHKRAVKNVLKPDDILNSVAKQYDMAVDALKTSVTRPMTAKKMVIYLLKKKTGMTNEQIGGLFAMKLSAVSKAAKNFEKDILGNKRLGDTVKKISSSFEV
jgi:chromosomal replication initiation ATPase DnaA